jgi:hypothetical protein
VRRKKQAPRPRSLLNNPWLINQLLSSTTLPSPPWLHLNFKISSTFFSTHLPASAQFSMFPFGKPSHFSTQVLFIFSVWIIQGIYEPITPYLARLGS